MATFDVVVSSDFSGVLLLEILVQSLCFRIHRRCGFLRFAVELPEFLSGQVGVCLERFRKWISVTDPRAGQQHIHDLAWRFARKFHEQ